MMAKKVSQLHTIRRTAHYYWRATWRYPWQFATVLLLILVAVLFGNVLYSYVLSLLIGQLSNYSGLASQQHKLMLLFLAFLGTEVVSYLAWRAEGFIYLEQQAKTMRDLERQVFNGVTLHSYRFFVSRFGGALVSQFTRFVKGYEDLEDTLLFEMGTSLIRMVAAIVILLIVAPAIGLSLLVWSILFTVSVAWLSIKKMPLTKKSAAADSKVTAQMADAITNALNIKIFAQGGYEAKRFAATSQERFMARRRSWYADEYIRAYQAAVMIGFEMLVMWLSINLIVNHAVSIAVVLLAQLYITRIFADLWGLSNIMRHIERAFSEAAEMTEILDMPLEVRDPARPEPLRINHGEIMFNAVRFRYEDDNQPVFDGFTLHVPPGQKVGLVGHSGSGKTTLTKLLLRFGDLEAGQITIDGQNIANLRQDDLRSQIAYVPQEPVLFHRSLIDNIRYGRRDATDAEVHEVARLAHAADFIEQLPKGYETLVGERGIKLSGGEKQRIAIARAMLSQAPILLLDEATSALDSKSEKLIAEALERLMRGRTTIVIAHRLSTIRRLDRIVVMDKGKIAEEGTHDELIAHEGVYHELWSHQAGDFIAE